MRCGCPECGEYMIQAEGKKLGCVCPVCGYACRDCMGTNTVVSRENLADLAFEPRFAKYVQPDAFTGDEDEEDPTPLPPAYEKEFD